MLIPRDGVAGEPVSVEVPRWAVFHILGAYDMPDGRVALIGASYDQLFVTVSDQGPGVSPAFQNQIFRPFSRGPSEHEEVEGIGLGLYVSKRILEAHGGSIEVTSSDGRGATFQMTLPRGLTGAEAEPEPAALHSASGEQWSSA